MSLQKTKVMKEKRPYQEKEPESSCVHEPIVGYVSQSKMLPMDESEKNDFERLRKEGMTVEECRTETKRLIREIAAKKHGNR